MMERNHHLDLAEHPPPASAWIKDGRIKAAVVAAPALAYFFGRHGLQGVRQPLQIWAAGDDHVLSEPWNSETLKNDLPSPPDYHLVPGADHGDFGNICSPAEKASAPGFCRSPSGFDRDEFQAVFVRMVVAFFESKLGKQCVTKFAACILPKIDLSP